MTTAAGAGALGRYVGDKHEMRFVNGSVAKFCYCNNEGTDLMQYQGAEIDWLYFDELTHFSQHMYEFPAFFPSFASIQKICCKKIFGIPKNQLFWACLCCMAVACACFLAEFMLFWRNAL